MISAYAIERIDAERVRVECAFCHAKFSIPLTQQQQRRWERGAMIQHVIPEVSEDQRELLISGQCGKCFDAAFTELVDPTETDEEVF